MNKITRRKLIRQALVGVGALTAGQVIVSCTPQSTPAPAPTQAPTAVPTLAPTPILQPTTPPLPANATTAPATATAVLPTPTISFTATPVVPPDILVARGSDPEQLVIQAINAMGGMEKFVRKGAKVIIKPNICVAYGTYDNAYTTNPWVVGALVKLCLAAGAASVRIFDYPFNGTSANAYVRSGIEAQVKAAGGEMIQWVGYKYVPTKISQGKELKTIGVYDDILKADAIINVPIAKHHSLSRLTMGMKNLMGVIDDRMEIHPNFGQRLADLSTLIKPVLNVLDAVRVLKNNGPASGTKDDVLKLDTIVVTQDIVACDAYGATLFGLKPDDLKYVVAGYDMKLGKKDLSSLKIQEIKVGA